MNPRQHIVAIVIGSLLLVMFLVMGFFLYRKVIEYRQSSIALGRGLALQKQLYGRQPFPSPENIEREHANLDRIREEFRNLLELLSDSQVEPVDQKPAAFSTQFWKVREELLAQARDRRIGVPSEFAFGFQRHMAGDLTPYPDVPRLTQQLIIVQELCKVLYEAKIDELKAVIREEFEGDTVAGTETGVAPVTPVPSGRRGARSAPPTAVVAENPVVKETGVIPEGELFGKMHFVFRFSARESVVFDILNKLARHPLLIVVSRVDLVSEEPAVSHLAGPPAAPEAATPSPAEGGEGSLMPPPARMPAPDPTDRDQRIRYGRESKMAVTLEVDVYRFRKEDNGKRS
jgi:hypothetical protein